MKRIVIVLFLFLVQSVTASQQEQNFGTGIILGEPTGLNFKLWQSNTTAYDAAFAWSISRQGNIHIHVDYLLHNYEMFKIQKGKFPFYAGIGGRIESKEETALGLRIPLGMNYIFEQISIDLFLEFVPTLNVIPATEFDLEGGIGARYYF